VTVSLAVCLAGFAGLLWLLRRDQLSLGLPAAYLAALLLLHAPGAFAHLVSRGALGNDGLVRIGIEYTAVGVACFVAGVWLARSQTQVRAAPGAADRASFRSFCLIGGWIVVYALTPLQRIPSLEATIDRAGAAWVLAVALGLRASLREGDPRRTAAWLAAMALYPTLMLLLSGFLSYGSTAAIIVGAAVAVSTQRSWKVVAGVALAAIVSLSVFVNYFVHRDQIRAEVWGGASIERRLDVVGQTIAQFEPFDPGNLTHLQALDARLNQNYFVGLAATRIKNRDVDYLGGRSLWEGLLAIVPRAIWPNKPVYGGSPEIVAEMTGLQLNKNTSFGVGNVMEFQINFGLPGVVAGFLGLGLLIGFLDLKAAAAERRGDLGEVFLFFLPAVALIQPNGSMVELAGGSAAALVGAVAWRWAWSQWLGARLRTRPSPGPAE
jgi:membrane protein implicated in regulation of membrane protease activity